MPVVGLLDKRLVLVTGKGGAGKTTLASALGLLSASRGRRTLVAEVDAFQSSLPAMLGVQPGFTPVNVAPGLDACNITWRESLELWLEQNVPVQRIVRLVLGNRIVQLFLDATPGVRETVVLSAVLGFTEQYDQVIVDLPASGHAVAILRVPHVAAELMRTGPIRERSEKLVALFGSEDSAMVLVALPEEMVVNETVELWDKVHSEVPGLRLAGVVLNRAVPPTLNDHERLLLERLDHEPPDGPLARELLLAGRWEAELEEATGVAFNRLSLETGASVVQFPRLGALGGFEGGTDRIVRQMTQALARLAAAERQP